MTNSARTVLDAANLFASSLPPERALEAQEALRFARWFGPDRPTVELRAPDVGAYSEGFGNVVNSAARAEALKAFLAFGHKHRLMPERLVSHVRVPRTGTKRVSAPARIEARGVQLTAESRRRIEEELADQKARRPRMAEEIRLAAADKDVRENAPLEAAREALGQLEAKIRELEATLRHAVLVDDTPVAGDAAGLGSTVVLANVATGARLSYRLVVARDASPSQGRLSVDSPVGQAVVGHRAGEEVLVSAPSGEIRFRIESVEA
jgi:transcription elongation factor GreA